VVRAIVAFFALSHAIAWQQDNPLLIQRLDPLIQKIVSEVSQERIAEILKKLESFETRNTLSDPWRDTSWLSEVQPSPTGNARYGSAAPVSIT
jgi:hypothetical protein